MAKRKKLKQPAPRNPVARAMLTQGFCQKRVVENKKKRYNRSKQKAQDRKDLGIYKLASRYCSSAISSNSFDSRANKRS